MQENTLNTPETVNEQKYAAAATRYLNKVYLWMATALLTTSILAFYTAQSTELLTWLLSGMNTIILLIVSVALVLVMCFANRFFSPMALGVIFLTYSGVTGLIFGPLLLEYTQESLALTFAVTAGTFGAMSLFGAFTKKNLSGMGRFLLMALFGLIIASIANIFFGSGTLNLICSFAGVLIFSGLTAYDTQRLLAEGRLLEDDQMGKPAVMGALTLYLDFINLFLYLLRFLGNRD